jgi:hypothetical protein
MKVWAVATSLLAVVATVAVAVLLAMRAQANSDSSTAALALAERTTPKTQASFTPAVSAQAAIIPPASASATAPVSLDALPRVISFRQTNTYNGAIVYVPEGCQGSYDLILHFHGAHPYVKDLLEKANIQAVVAVFNAGNGAEKYAQAYGAGGTLSSLLRQVDMATRPLCPGGKLGRLALTAWSAGYSATEKLVTREEDRERVDAILLADGLHAGFTDPYRRLFAPNALLALRDFAALAKDGKKLFAITHSSIMTDGYGSTTECSRLLLKALGVPGEGELVSGKSGNFSVEGFTGDDKAAHIVQFRQMDRTLLAKLRERWTPRPETKTKTETEATGSAP